MSKLITNKQQKILECIKDHIKVKGFPPSIREIGKLTSISSTSTVSGHLNRLEKKGYIKREQSKPRAIQVLNRDEFVTEYREMENK